MIGSDCRWTRLGVMRSKGVASLSSLPNLASTHRHNHSKIASLPSIENRAVHMIMNNGFGVRESIAMSNLAIMVLKRLVNSSDYFTTTTDEQVKPRAIIFSFVLQPHASRFPPRILRYCRRMLSSMSQTSPNARRCLSSSMQGSKIHKAYLIELWLL